MKNLQCTLTGLLMLGTVFPAITAEPPHLIPFQGHLARPTAADPTQFEPVSAGRYDILFTLYAAPVGGESKVWGPERHAQVTVVNGLVNAMLGSIIGLGDAVAANPNFFARPLYVGITVDADGNPNTADLELVPRQVLLPSVYALGAMRADRLDGSDWRDFFVGTDTNGTFTVGATKARDADKLDGFDWSNVFGGNGHPTNTILADRIADSSITGNKIAAQTIPGSALIPGTVTSQQIAPATITAANLHSSLTIDSIIPPGTISAFGGPTNRIPAGWLVCDGQALRTNDYPALFAAIGNSWGEGSTAAADDFSLPDLRGMFLRGVNGGRGGPLSDPDYGGRGQQATGGNTGDNVGSVQDDALQNVTGMIGEFNGFAAFRGTPTGPFRRVDNTGGGTGISSGSADQYHRITMDLSLVARSSSETRPNNAYVNYIIKH